MALSTTKRWLLGAGGVVIAAIAGVAIFAATLDRAKLLEEVRTQLEPRLNRKVALGGGDFSLIPPTLLIESFTIADDPAVGASAAPFARARQLEVKLGILALFRGKVQVDSIMLREPVVELVRLPNGKWNYSTLGVQDGSPQAGAGSASGSGEDAVAIGRFEIVDGTVGVTDLSPASGNRNRIAYEHIDLLLRDYAPGKTFSIDLSARLAGSKDSTVSWKGSGTGADQMEGRVLFRNAGVASIEQFLNQKPTGLDANLTGDLEIRLRGDVAEARGAVEASGLRYRKRTADLPVRLDVDISANQQAKTAHVARADLKLGGASISATGDAHFSEPKTVLKLRVVSKDSPILELRRLVALSGANPGYDTKGLLTADVNADGPVDRLAFSGTAAIRGLEVKAREWKTAVRSPSIDVTLSPEALEAKPFSLEAGGTRLSGMFRVADYLHDGLLSAEIKTAGSADLAELIHMAQAFGISSEGASGEGSAMIDIRVRGPVKNPAGLDFTGSAVLSGAMLSLPSLTKPVKVAKANVRFQQNSASIEDASLSIGPTAIGGRLAMKNFSKPVVEFALEADRVNPAELSTIFRDEPELPAGSKPASPGRASQSATGANRENGREAMSTVSGGGTFRIGTLQLTDITLTQVSGRCQFRGGQLDIHPFTAKLFNGTVEGAIAGDFSQAAPLVSVDARLAKVDANQLLSAATPAKQVMLGTLGANAKLSFRSGEPAALTRSLNGVLDFKLENGRINGVNLLNEIAKVARFLGYARQETAFTNVVLLGGTLDLKDGIASTNNLAMELDGAKLGSAGTIDLNAQKLALRMTATLSKELSSRVGGTQVGGFMVTAMANEASQLVVPVHVSGPMSSLKVTPDAEKFAQMKMKSLTPAKVQEAIQVLKGSDDKLKGVLDIFKKKKKDEPPGQK